MNTGINKIKLSILITAALSACQMMDQHAQSWSQLRVGDSRQQAVLLLGEPSKVTALEVPLVSIEQCAWKAIGGRTYIAHFAMNHLVAKSVID
jgi:hypothetical protein